MGAKVRDQRQRLEARILDQRQLETKIRDQQRRLEEQKRVSMQAQQSRNEAAAIMGFQLPTELPNSREECSRVLEKVRALDAKLCERRDFLNERIRRESEIRDECPVCMERFADHVFVPCGHRNCGICAQTQRN